jgi:hypothetical protein
MLYHCIAILQMVTYRLLALGVKLLALGVKAGQTVAF